MADVWSVPLTEIWSLKKTTHRPFRNENNLFAHQPVTFLNSKIKLFFFFLGCEIFNSVHLNVIAKGSFILFKIHIRACLLSQGSFLYSYRLHI